MPGKQVKNWDVYHDCRKEGHSKETCAKIANSVESKKSDKKGK
jgi:hypothetical protein